MEALISLFIKETKYLTNRISTSDKWLSDLLRSVCLRVSVFLSVCHRMTESNDVLVGVQLELV